MNVMRRLKSIASGRSSVSDPGGDFNMKRVKSEQEVGKRISGESHSIEKCSTSVEKHMDSASQEAAAGTSHASSSVRPEKSHHDELPKKMNEMKIQENKSDNHDYKDVEATVVSGNGTETGQIISTTVRGQNGQQKKTMSYMPERVVGTVRLVSSIRPSAWKLVKLLL